MQERRLKNLMSDIFSKKELLANLVKAYWESKLSLQPSKIQI